MVKTLHYTMLLFACVSATVVSGADLEKAKTEFESHVSQSKQKIITRLSVLKSQARKAGDSGKLDLIATELEAFERKGELPTTLGKESITYQRSMRQAREKLIGAYEQSVKDLIRAGMDAEAKTVQAELDEQITKYAKAQDFRTSLG